MLTPDRVGRAADRSISVFLTMDTEMREELARRLLALEDIDRTAIRRKLQSIGADYRRVTERAITDDVGAAARVSAIADEARYAEARVAGLLSDGYVPLSESLSAKAAIQDGILNARNLGNIVRTRAVEAMYAEFVDVLDEALLGVVTQTVAPQTAIRRAVRTLAKGQTHVHYTTPTGEIRTTLYAAVRRNVTTAANQTALRVTDARMTQLGVNYVEVSAHSGARPDHAEWQGEIMPRDELEARTGYGQVDGLGGANCRHGFWPYFPGLSEPTFAELAQDPDVNEAAYALEQRQRESERNIRRYRDRARVERAGGLTDDAKKSDELAAKWRREADRVVSQSGGKRRRDREAG